MSTKRTAEESTAMEHALMGSGFVAVDDAFPEPSLFRVWDQDEFHQQIRLAVRPHEKGWWLLVSCRQGQFGDEKTWKGINLGTVRDAAPVLRIASALSQLGSLL